MTSSALMGQAATPESPASRVRLHRTVIEHFKIPEIQNVHRPVHRAETHVDRSQKSILHEWLQCPIPWIDADYRSTNPRPDRSCHWHLFSEERDEQISRPLGRAFGGDIKLDRRRVRRKAE